MAIREERNHALDTVRALMFPLGLVFAATESFLPGFAAIGWPIVDQTPSWGAAILGYVLHIFRLSSFFMLSGFFAHMVFHKRGAATYVKQRTKRILIPLVVGWLVFTPLIVLTFVWALYKRTHGLSAESHPANHTAVFNLTHLWFLYYLLWLNLIVLVVRGIILRFDVSGILRNRVDQLVRVTARNPCGPFLLAIPITLALIRIPNWWMWMGIPSPNTSLIPEFASLVAYGSAFSFGWLLHRQGHLMSAWSERWARNLIVAVFLTLADLYIVKRMNVTSVFFVAPKGILTLLYAVIYALAIWYWTYGLVGAALKYFAKESPLRRYFADSSYWVYFAHLPLVFALQVFVMQFNWHWTFKVLFILLVSYTILILIFHYLVRPTFIGVMLNGRRHVRAPLLRTLFPETHNGSPNSKTSIVDQASSTHGTQRHSAR